MEDIIQSLEIEFKRVINDLEFVNHRLEAGTRSNTIQNNSKHPDVLNIVKKIAYLQSKINTIKTKSKEVLHLRGKVKGPLTTSLLHNYSQIKAIINVSDATVDDEWISNANYVNDINVQSSSSSSGSSNNSNNNDIFQKININLESINNDNGNEDTENTVPINSNTNNNNNNNYNFTKNHTNKNTITITEEMFSSIPISSRGRAKHTEVVTVYEALLSVCENKRRNSTTLKELISSSSGNRGLKLGGRTGDAIISSLKKMNLIAK